MNEYEIAFVLSSPDFLDNHAHRLDDAIVIYGSDCINNQKEKHTHHIACLKVEAFMSAIEGGMTSPMVAEKSVLNVPEYLEYLSKLRVGVPKRL